MWKSEPYYLLYIPNPPALPHGIRQAAEQCFHTCPVRCLMICCLSLLIFCLFLFFCCVYHHMSCVSAYHICVLHDRVIYGQSICMLISLWNTTRLASFLLPFKLQTHYLQKSRPIILYRLNPVCKIYVWHSEFTAHYRASCHVSSVTQWEATTWVRDDFRHSPNFLQSRGRHYMSGSVGLNATGKLNLQCNISDVSFLSVCMFVYLMYLWCHVISCTHSGWLICSFASEPLSLGFVFLFWCLFVFSCLYELQYWLAGHITHFT